MTRESTDADVKYEFFLVLGDGQKPQTVRKILEDHNFRILEEKCEDGVVFKMAVPFEDMCVEAESQRLFKRLDKHWEDSLQTIHAGADGLKTIEAVAEFRRDHAADFQGFKEAAAAASKSAASCCSNAARFFQPWERVFLARRLLARPGNLSDNEATPHEQGHDGVSRLTADPLFLSLRRHGLVKEAGPLPAAPVTLPKSFFQADWINQVCAAFGPNIAMYFIFMRTFLIWLAPLALLGVLIWWRRPRGITVDEDTAVPFFSLAVVLWAAAFPRLIQHEESKFAFRWGCLDVEKREVNRHEFFGYPAVSPITGEVELHYPKSRRMLRYLVSATVTLVALVVPFLAMICSLNLQGYVHPPGSADAEGLETLRSPFYIRRLARFAKPGHVFDPDGGGPLGGWLSLVPTLLHVVVIGLLNAAFRRVAEQLTEFENHRTENDYENALIIKRFLFEAFDAYIALFYVGFYMRDPLRLRQELVSLYTMDWLRRLTTESLIPWVRQRIRMESEQRALGKRKKTDDQLVLEESIETLELNAYIQKEDYEQFDDYLEMVIGFGYVTLFAGAMPLAAALTFAGNVVEILSDAFKLNYVCRRPVAARSSSMPRPWFFVICCMCWAAIVTNSLIAYVSSEQVMHLIPSWFKDQGDTHEIRKKGLWYLFAGEHLLMVLAFVIHTAMPMRAIFVRNAVAAREFRRMRAAQREMARSRSTRFSQWLAKWSKDQ